MTTPSTPIYDTFSVNVFILAVKTAIQNSQQQYPGSFVCQPTSQSYLIPHTSCRMTLIRNGTRLRHKRNQLNICSFGRQRDERKTLAADCWLAGWLVVQTVEYVPYSLSPNKIERLCEWAVDWMRSEMHALAQITYINTANDCVRWHRHSYATAETPECK